MRALVAMLALTACGRIGFDLTGGASVGDDGNGPGDDGTTGSGGPPFVLAGAPGHGSFSGMMFTTPIPTLVPGNLWVVAFVFRGASTTQITGITDNGGNTYARFGSRSVDTGCPSATEVWWTSVTASATSMTMVASAMSNVDFWVLEIKGPSSSPYVSEEFTNTAVANTQPHLGTTQPPNPGAILGVIGSCGTVTGIPSISPLTALSTTNGGDLGYAFTTGTALVSADFTTTNATWTSCMIVLH